MFFGGKSRFDLVSRAACFGYFGD